jgi:phosphomannomutase
MEKIKFGTDGWRAIIAKDFTITNIIKVTYATSLWLARKYRNPSAVIGYDCRFAGEMFMEAVAKILASRGVRVYIPEHFVSAPMVSLGVIKLKAQCGIIITASHDPPGYNGFKLKGEYGGPMLEKDVKDVENLITQDYDIDLELLNWNYLLEQGMINYIDLENIYIKQIKDNFNIDSFANSKLKFAFDAMYGSGQNIFKKLIPGIKLFHCELNPTFKGIPPDPQHKNLHELAEYMWKSKKIDCGMAVDGDADRVALYDKEGNYVDAHHIILLLIHYLAGYKKLKGKVIAGFSCTSKIEKLCKNYEIDIKRVKVGFKDIANLMKDEEILLYGEESGDITIGSHIPERDGIWAGLLIWQLMIETGKSLKKLIHEVYEITGRFAVEKSDINVNKNERNKILEKCQAGYFNSFGNYEVIKTESLDGYKFFFNEDQWLMIRLSGTEPVLRMYAEAETQEVARDILSASSRVIINK